MKNIAIISTVGLKYDGITSIILSYLESMNRDGMNFYVISSWDSDSRIEQQFIDLGCKVIKVPSRKKNPIKYMYYLTKIIRNNEIDIIHVHGNSATMCIELMAGVLGGSNKRIVHSHNTKCEWVKADKLLRPIFYRLYTDALACGLEAGKWLYKDREFIILNNGRDVKKYCFSMRQREECRKKLKINEELVIGHVGGFFEQKNHEFIVKVFKEILKKNTYSKLLLIGDGPLKKQVETSVNDIADRVIFVPKSNKIPKYLNSMDAIIFPSLYEGFPLVTIESQMNGLPCLVSDTVTKDCKLTDLLCFLSLDVNEKLWANKLLDMISKSKRIEDSAIACKLIKKSGFDINDNSDILRNIYLS